ncbi:porin, partial [Arenibaculum sp.]|uniref:porin n=1 Tax=Arenibaculum sp. TaxID=2865862 RepID=UPI002E11A79D|nr:porin [Arenibaculum sp.]
LFGTTALLGGLLLAQGASAAETTVKIGGDIRFDAGYIDDDLNGDPNDISFLSEFRLPITMDAVADNGLQYGAMVRIRNTGQAGTGIQADRRFIYVGGDWGRVEMGSEWGVTTKLEVMAPTIGIGQIDGTWGDFSDLGEFSYSHATEYDRSTKIAYYTPRFAGFQAGVSYAPERDAQGDANRRLGGTYEDQVEIGANYTGDFSGFGVKLGAGYTMAEAKTAGVDDLSSWYAGAQASIAGFVVGGGYFDDGENATGVEEDGWNAGVTYTMGDLAVGASYGMVESGATEDTLWSVGASYLLAPGLSANLDLYFFDAENADPALYTGGSNEGTMAVFRTRLTF